MTEEAMQRHHDMVEAWKVKGHPDTPCVGHKYPLPNCPKPEVHDDVA